MDQKVKSLYSISIEGSQINTQLHYNINTNHIGIGTVFSKRKHNMIIRICENCNKKDQIRYSSYKSTKYPNLCRSCLQINRKFSEKSKIKMSNSRTGKNNHQWRGGISFGKYCNLFNESFKQSVRDRFHNKCYLCSKSKIDNNRKLSVHHVNYDKNCLCGSSCEFVPLCSKCHGKTSNKRFYYEDLIMCYLYPNRYFMVDI